MARDLMARRFVLVCSALVSLHSADAVTFTVSNTADAGPGSFRQAILDANATAGADTIAFAISGCPGAAPVCTIAPTSNLSALTDPVTIDGYLNGMGTPNTLPSIRGTNAVLGIELDLSGADALDVRGGSSTIRGLIVNRSQSAGIRLSVLGGNHVEGNFLGTNPAGTTAGPGNETGVLVVSNDNVIGGPAPAQRNLISGNGVAGVGIGSGIAGSPASNNALFTRVENNLIGTDALGTSAIATQAVGVAIVMDPTGSSGRASTIGGLAHGSGNVISGNAQYGVTLQGGSLGGPSGDNEILGNRIGVSPSGDSLLSNGNGVWLLDQNTGNLLDGNQISSNTGRGVVVDTSANTLRRNLIGLQGDGFLPAGNGNDGVSVNADNNLIQDNAIGWNGGAGVSVGATDPTTSGVAIFANRMRSNTLEGIELVGGANGSPVAPALTTATISGHTLAISGQLTGVTPGAEYRIDLFSSLICDPTGGGEGFTPLAAFIVGADGVGDAGFFPTGIPIPTGQGVITATATRQFLGHTSRFSVCFPATGVQGDNTPVAVSDTFTATVDVPLHIGAPGILLNDSDPDGDPISAILASPPASGSLELFADGSFDYTPPPGFVGTEFFAYRAFDGTQTGGLTSVRIDVAEGVVPPPIPTLSGWLLALLTFALVTVGLGALSQRRPRMKSTRLLLAVATASFVTGANAATFTVLNTADSGAGSLRQAMLDANAAAGADTIDFSIASCPGAPPVCTIAPASALPILTQPVTIDGYANGMGTPNTNPPTAGTNAVLGIEINLAAAGCLDVRGGSSIVRGLVINRSPTYGICLATLGDNAVTGNFIGTNPAGTAAGPGNENGIAVISDDNRVGGNVPAERNLISGNVTTGVQIGNGTANAPATNNGRFAVLEGNLIGTNAAGTAAIPTQTTGVAILMDSASFSGRQAQIGGDVASERNVISGHSQDGVLIFGGSLLGPGDNDVEGNYIGTDVTGTVALPNRDGIGVTGFNGGNFITGNLISGNTGPGLVLGTNDNSATLNRVGTDGSGTTAVPNGGVGIQVDVGDNNLVRDNVVAFNLSVGVLVGTDPSTLGAVISRNSIHSNSLAGIDLSPGANSNQTVPVIGSAAIAAGTLTVSGSLSSVASSNFNIEVFSNVACDTGGAGEGRSYLGATTMTTNGAGSGAFGPLVVAIPAGQTVITATATRQVAGETSEFSLCVNATGGTPNATPVANPDSYSTPFETTLNVAAPGVLGNDTDADPLTAVLLTPSATGVLSLSADGSFTFTPATGFSGPVTFTYGAFDGFSTSLPATVTITVGGGTPAAPIPTLSDAALALLAAAIVAIGLSRLRSGA